MLSSLLNFIRSTAFYYIGGTLVGVGVVSLLGRIWQSMGLRFFLLGLGGVLLCILLVVAIALLWRVLQRRRGDSMESALGQDAIAKQQRQQQAKVAVQGIKDRWSEAMVTLKATNVRIYDLPWLLLIGEPQSGKTTTLRESGLDFPLGKDAMSGGGGTVNCDWWFTNEAVILDTAGRFTMPVDTAPDREEWHSFLKLLASHRPRCPINGVIVTIPATSLLQDSPEAIKNKALTIREKLQELVAVLGIEYPVYIMVSKLDLVYGFAEFCASLSTEERKQALGWNRQIMTADAFKPEEFNAFFAALVSRLSNWAKRRLREINPGAETDRVYAFPGEFDRLKDGLAGYLSLIFRPDRYHIPLLLRGCFFSSGLQEGRSIARALLDGAEGSDRAVLAEFAKSFMQSRAYFINAFYSKVFKERWLVKRAGGATKKEIILRFAAAGFAVLFIAISGAMLVSGYRSLVNKVQPLEQQVRKAQTLLLDEKNGQGISASEVVQLISTLESGRQELISHGAKRFLRTSGNVLVGDVGRIEDALFERKFLDMLVSGAGKDFGDEKSLATTEEKEKLYNIVTQYIDFLAGKEINVQSLSFLLDRVPWNSPEGLDIDRAEAELIIQSYPYSRGSGAGPRNIKMGGLYVRQALTSIYKFWNSFYGMQWQEQKQKIALINSTYADLLGAGMLPHAEDSITGNERFVQLANNFKEAVAEIDPLSTGKVLVWTDALRENCKNDYLALGDKLAEAGVPEIVAMAATVDRHSAVCTQLESSVGREWGTALDQNIHILATDGSVNPEMYLVRDVVLKLADFGPLFDADKQDRLKVESDNPLPVLALWNQTWEAQRDENLKAITAGLENVNSKGWEKKELLAFCTEQLKNTVLQADQESAMAALQVVLPTDATAVSTGTETPKVMRAAWLASRFKLLQQVGDWLQSHHPGTPGLSNVRSEIAVIMGASWSNCLKFWSEKLNAVDPTAGILKTNSWQDFRKQVLARHGVFIDLGAWPLSAFSEFMANKDVQEVKEIMSSAGGDSTSSSARALEIKIINTGTIYASVRFLPQLDEAQSSFSSVVENLTDNPRDSWQMLMSGKPGEKVSMDNFKSLGGFQRLISRDPAGRGEPMALRLAKIEDHGLSLLQRDFSSKSRNDWTGFVRTWQARLAGKFPFGNREVWGQVDSVDNNVRKLVFVTETRNNLYDFFFSPDQGLESFVKRYNLTAADLSGGTAFLSSQADKEFLENCLAWRDFLFDKDGRPLKHQVKITLDDGQGESSVNAQKYFTELRISGLDSDLDKSIRLRFSGQKYKSATLNWDLGSNSEVFIEAKNEETGVTTEIRMSGGSLAFPAYVFWEGRGETVQQSGDLSINMLFPKVGSNGERVTNLSDARTLASSHYVVPATISWDQALPANILWPSK